MEMIKIGTSKSFLTEEYRKVIFPLLFHYVFNEKSNWYKNDLYDETYDDIDLYIVPVELSFLLRQGYKKWLLNKISYFNKKNIPVWLYSSGDFGKTLHLNITTFRLGGFNSKLKICMLDRKVYFKVEQSTRF